MHRVDIINHLIRKYKFENYLEIGVCDPNDCFAWIECRNKTGVDPGIEYPPNPVEYKMTSDEFFDNLNSGNLDLAQDHKWDLIFIDGLHLSFQVQKDLINSLEHLSEGGLILLHDCNPPNIYIAREDYIINGRQDFWCGTVWKVIYWLRTHRSDLKVCVLDTDWGVGVITRGNSQLIEFDNPFYEYNQFAKNRIENLNLISALELENWLTK